jgi:leucine dehydrogenase
VDQEVSALELARELGHEEVVIVNDVASGLHAVIAIHDTTLGPAVGGTRMRNYASFDDAVADALRLARAMTYKAVLAGVERGGGKGVIVGDPGRDKSRALLAAYAKVVDRMGGRFVTGCDMGIDLRDVAVLSRMTKYASHTPAGSKVDTADLAALGVLHSIRAAGETLGLELRELRVAIQGLGQLGYRLAKLLAAEGAGITVADVDPARVERAQSELGADTVEPEAIYEVDVHVFSPNAAGGVLNDTTLERLRCRAVVGGANEQLGEPRHGDRLHERGILYAPDYVVNAGGLLSLLFEIGDTDEAGVLERVRAIGDRVKDIWARARASNCAPHRVADRIAEERLREAREQRRRRW